MSAYLSHPTTGGPRILVGVDGSADGLRAVKYATKEALSSGSDVWIVHAVDDMVPITGLWDVVSNTEVLKRAGEAAVAEASATATHLGLPADRVITEVVLGPPTEVLVEFSAKARLLVMGRRSLLGLERMFVGSTSVAAAVRAACPVVVISAASTPHETGGLSAVAVAVSTWPLHESVVEWGAREAAARRARLRVVHVVPETLGVEGPQFVATATAGLSEQLAPFRQKHPEVTVEVEVMLGDPISCLVDVSKSVDLLILGVHHNRAVLGGPIRAVIAHAHCPVGLIR